MFTNLTTQQVENVQIDESVVFFDYGLSSERFLAPTRGGGNFIANVTIRDIEFDGRHGPTAGMQTIDDQTASLKVTTINLSQDELLQAVPGARVTGTGTDRTIKNPKSGLIPLTAYLKNITVFAKMIGNKFKKITIHRPMNEGSLDVKFVQKAEGELGLEFKAHYATSDLDGDLWEINEVTTAPTFPTDQVESSSSSQVESSSSSSSSSNETPNP